MKKRKCVICGFTTASEDPPDICPVCGADRKFFEDDEDIPAGSKESKPS